MEEGTGEQGLPVECGIDVAQGHAGAGHLECVFQQTAHVCVVHGLGSRGVHDFGANLLVAEYLFTEILPRHMFHMLGDQVFNGFHQGFGRDAGRGQEVSQVDGGIVARQNDHVVHLELAFISITFDKALGLNAETGLQGRVFLALGAPYLAVDLACGVLKCNVPVGAVSGLCLAGGCQEEEIIDRLARGHFMDILRLFSHVSCH